MADQTGIEWTDATWNPVAGCAVVSPGCTNCYAMKFAARLATMPQAKAKYAGLTQPSKAGPVWTGKIALDDAALIQPMRWKKPRRIFVNSMSDLFQQGVPFAFVDAVFRTIELAPQHTYQILTKRPERMRDWALARCGDGGNIPPNVWLGVSVENQNFADERIPLLLDTPAAVRWISAEPLLGPIDLVNLHPRDDITVDAIRGQMVTREGDYSGDEPRLDWVVVGGESGPEARPMHPDWARSIRDQCAAAEVPFFFKQWGEWLDETVATASGHAPGPSMFDAQGMPTGDRWHFHDPDDPIGRAMIRIGKKAAGHLLDGVEHREFPR